MYNHIWLVIKYFYIISIFEHYLQLIKSGFGEMKSCHVASDE